MSGRVGGARHHHGSVAARTSGGVRARRAGLCRRRGRTRPVPCPAPKVRRVQSVSLFVRIPFISLIAPQPTTMAAPSSSFVSTASFPSRTGALLTTYPSQSGSQGTTRATHPSPMSSPHSSSSSVQPGSSISVADAQSITSRTGSESPRSVLSPTTHSQLISPHSSPAISPPYSTRCKITFPVRPLFTSRPVHVQPRSPSPPSLTRNPPSPCPVLNLAMMIDPHCHRNPSHLRSPSCPHALSRPPPPPPLLIPMYAHLSLALKPFISPQSSSRPTCTIGPPRPTPSNHVFIPDHQHLLHRACMRATEILCDHPSNSPENHPLPPLLITAHLYPRTPFQPCPFQIHNLRRPIFDPQFLPRL